MTSPRRPSAGRRSRREGRYLAGESQRASPQSRRPTRERPARRRSGPPHATRLPAMEGSSLGLAVAFSAGLLSFLSPCVLPLIPSYVTFITGLSLDDAQQARRAALVH